MLDEFQEQAADDERYRLRLYVAGQTPKSVAAITNLKRLCEQYVPGRYEIEVVDLMKDPGRAKADQVVAIPTLVRRLPPPIKRVIGDLSKADRVLIGLDVHPLRSAEEKG